MGIIKRICNSCSCNEQEAQEYLDDEIRHLRDLQSVDDLQYDDFEAACQSLGLESDFVQFFILQLAC
jgi:hypothetical protein|nr:MAG TPA: hypothetical protein [Caudoviricetes sp.]